MSITEVGNLSLVQYKALLDELNKSERNRYKNLLIICRAAQADDSAFSAVLDHYEG